MTPPPPPPPESGLNFAGRWLQRSTGRRRFCSWLP